MVPKIVPYPFVRAFRGGLEVLTHMGHKEYAKGDVRRFQGDGRRFHDYLSKEYPDVKSRCVGRAEMSKRQDWCAEVSWNFFNLITPIITFTVSMCALDANILRDAVLVRLENIRFEAYVHVNALMWKVAFAELRALTNWNAITESGLGLNPMELNALYEYLWNLFGVLLKTDGCLAILQPEFRPWPKVHEGDYVSAKFYMCLDKNTETNMAELNDFHTRSDVIRYTQVLKQQLGLFGAGILISLERTMGHYLQVRHITLPPKEVPIPSVTLSFTKTKVTSGKFRNELLTDAQMEEVAQLLCTNNPGERPFAVAKAYLALYGRMDLATLARFSLSVCNG
jgi:hypothetical protein